MHTVFSGPQFQVLEYPMNAGFEVIDKENGTMGFLHGAVAAAFREHMNELAAAKPSVEEVEEYLHGFDDLIQSRLVAH